MLGHEQINFEQRISVREQILLYYYDVAVRENKVDYADWRLTEELISSYNTDENMENYEKVATIMYKNERDIQVLQEKYRKTPWEVEKPVIWSDREKSEYYINNLEESHKFEIYAESIFKQYGLDIGLYYGKSQQYNLGESKAGIEIKCDKRSQETGNYYFEYQERLNAGGEWINSGLLKEDNTKYYFYGVIGSYAIFPKSGLLEYYRKIILENCPPTGCRKVEAKRGTSKGFIISKEEAFKIRLFPKQVAQMILQENGNRII